MLPMRRFAEKSKQPLDNMKDPDPGQETESKMVWPLFKVFWFSKDNPTGHSEKEKEKEAARRRVSGRQYQRMNFASSTRASENRTRWKGIIANSSLLWCPEGLPML